MHRRVVRRGTVCPFSIRHNVAWVTPILEAKSPWAMPNSWRFSAILRPMSFPGSGSVAVTIVPRLYPFAGSAVNLCPGGLPLTSDFWPLPSDIGCFWVSCSTVRPKNSAGNRRLTRRFRRGLLKKPALQRLWTRKISHDSIVRTSHAPLGFTGRNHPILSGLAGAIPTGGRIRPIPPATQGQSALLSAAHHLCRRPGRSACRIVRSGGG